MTQEAPTGPGGTGLKPRLVLMGEFSAGKSTLSNILLGGQTLPTQVTATRLPPVIVTHGAPGAHAIAHDGSRIEVDLSDLSALSPEAIRSLHVTMICDTLELCDLVDMPGISDPNMPADTWDEVVRSTDHVLWCTHATQAWRQSEAAMWDRLRGATSGTNLLLITQFDKLRNPRDKARVLARVVSETVGKFTATYPVSLLEAIEAGEDIDLWKASGAHDFMEHLVEMLLTPVAPAPLGETAQASRPQGAAPVAVVGVPASTVIEIPRPSQVAGEARQAEALVMAEQTAASDGVRVLPRRVQVQADKGDGPRTPRPSGAPEWLNSMGPGGI